ncbi:MAG: GntR family transcriptional regulator [Ruminococcus sp.]|nr:GntR family transcriptional regulator [Ruminococcus sp.]
MINLDLTGREPIYLQICKGFSQLIAGGNMKENDKLPGARTLAKELGLNPNTVAKAYSRLEHDGIIYSVPGKGCFVAKQKGTIEQKLYESFDKSAAAALKAGITAKQLKGRVDQISQDQGKEEQPK